MTKGIRLSAALLGCALAAGALQGENKPAAKPAAAVPDQQVMEEAMAKMAAVGPNHKLLASLEGEWTTETRFWMDPSQPPQMVSGTSSNRMTLGGRFLHSMHKGTIMGQPFEGVGTWAFDNLSGEFVSTWADNMSTGLFYQTGGYDAARRTFTMRGEMNDPMAPKTKMKVRTVTRIVDADNYVFEWHETHGGKEAKTLEVAYKRAK